MIRILPFTMIVASVARADLFVTKMARSKGEARPVEVIVQRCSNQLPLRCASPALISDRELKQLASTVGRMSTHLATATAAAMRAMPFTPPHLFDAFATTKRIHLELENLSRAKGGRVIILESDPGAGDVVEMFERATAVRHRYARKARQKP